MTIVYLDPDDEITTAVARIRDREGTSGWRWCVPTGSRIATSRINFRLLAHEALEPIPAPGDRGRRNRPPARWRHRPGCRSTRRSSSTRRPAGGGRVAGRVSPRRRGPAPCARPVPRGGGSRQLAGPGAAARHRVGAGLGLADAKIGAALERGLGTGDPIGRPASGTDGSPHLTALAAAAMLVVVALMAPSCCPPRRSRSAAKVEAVGPSSSRSGPIPTATSSDPVGGVVPAVQLTTRLQLGRHVQRDRQARRSTTAATGSVTFTSINTVSRSPFPAARGLDAPAACIRARPRTVTIPRAKRRRHERPSRTVGVKAVKARSGRERGGGYDQPGPERATSTYRVHRHQRRRDDRRHRDHESLQGPEVRYRRRRGQPDQATQGPVHDLASTRPTRIPPGSTAFPKTGVRRTPIARHRIRPPWSAWTQTTFTLTLTATATVDSRRRIDGRPASPPAGSQPRCRPSTAS